MSIKRQEKSLFLSKIYVSKNYRGKKIGKTAMAFVEAKAMKMQCKSITLTVNKYNVNSIAAYETMGFKNMGEMITDIGEGFIMDDYKMEKLL
jgi:ribosomal protein S18 acetylase RimI-like enzyme